MRETPAGLVDLGVMNAKATWAEELGGFAGQPEVIKKALGNCGALKMPPTLPEFRQMCRDEASRPAKVSQIGYTQTEEDKARQREASQAIAEAAKKKSASQPKIDYLAWARNPKTQYAMSAVWSEANRGNSVMRSIADDLVARGVCDGKGNLKK